MLWRNLDSGVLYEVVNSTDDMVFISTECLQCTSTPTLSEIDQVKQEVASGKWAAKYPIAEDVLQKILEYIGTFCEGKNVHWITLSAQDGKTVVKMEFNDCSRDGGGIWDIVERLRRKYPETNYNGFRGKKLNKYKIDESSEAQELLEEVKTVIGDDEKFSALVKEMEDLVIGNTNLLINLSEFNRLLYGSDYLERVAYAWTAAKKVTNVALVPADFRVEIPESRIVGMRNGYLIFKRSGKMLQLILTLFSVGLAGARIYVHWVLGKSELTFLPELSLPLIMTCVIGILSVVSLTSGLLNIARGLRLPRGNADALKHYDTEEDFIGDVYNRGMASSTLCDENSCALKRPNGLGWYRISNPMRATWLKRMGVQIFWRYDSSISVMVCGVKRVAYKVAVDKWHVGNEVDLHGGPKVHLLSGWIGMRGSLWAGEA